MRSEGSPLARRWWTSCRTGLSIASLCLGGLCATNVACSGSPKKDAEDPDKWDMADADPTPSSKPSSHDGDDDDDAQPDPAPTKPKPKPLSQEDDYEINHSDCDALAGAYGQAWENDEMKKLNAQKLPQAQFEKSKEGIVAGAADMRQNWRDECYGTVGTAYLRSRLKCAMKARSLERFNNCMDGIADE